MTELLHSGEPAPEFTLADFQGRRVSLSDYHGRPVVLIVLRGFL